eukprot:TRINITY_DN3636_c0_g1_i1.p1 TRINITY_DN3636_c0_g1~~TRINITY_DN3636_c0_g1_i1.p1  ORF type:complete len:293 (+),score=51.48 TRINITY_DN3636_c0_g1_i1:27-905(+)
MAGFGQDVSGVCFIEHVNLDVVDQPLAISFYCDGLGATLNPRREGSKTDWVNVGFQQFHLGPAEVAQMVDGEVGLLLPSLEDLKSRLTALEGRMAGTKFSWKVVESTTRYTPVPYNGEVVVVTCPSGNLFVCYQASEKFGMLCQIGILYVLHFCPLGTVTHIQNYFEKYYHAVSLREKESDSENLRISAGPHQQLIFKETEKCESYSDFHVCFYVNNFSDAYHRAATDGVLHNEHRFTDKSHSYEEALSYFQIRMLSFPDDQGKEIFKFHQEVRSCYHPSYHKQWPNKLGSW